MKKILLNGEIIIYLLKFEKSRTAIVSQIYIIIFRDLQSQSLEYKHAIRIF